MFQNERDAVEEMSSKGMNLGAIYGLAGAVAGTIAGGPAVGAAAASLGSAMGNSIGVSKGSGSSNQNSEESSDSKSKASTDQSSQKQESHVNSMYAMMFINIVYYEAALDVVTPEMLTEGFIKDYINLPDNYNDIGAYIQFQRFLIRYGTHYVKSAKFGAQLKIVKTMKSTSKMSEEDFAKQSQEEMKAMTNSLQSEASSKQSSWKLFGIGESRQEQSSSSKAKATSNDESKQDSQTEDTSKKESTDFSETTVTAQGGNPAIAEALFDFYSPSFKGIFSDWLASIPDYVKPFTFVLRKLDDLLDIRMESLFPIGQHDFGCAGSDPAMLKNLKFDNETGKYYYMRDDIQRVKNHSQLFKRKVICRYKNLDGFTSSLRQKKNSLKRAITIYLTEGPTPTDSFSVVAGDPGCEVETMAYVGEDDKKSFPTYRDLQSKNVKVKYEAQLPIGELIQVGQSFEVTYKGKKWYSMNPGTNRITYSEGCSLPYSDHLSNPVCINGLLFSYVESSGKLLMNERDYSINLQIVANLHSYFNKSLVLASASVPDIFNEMAVQEGHRKGMVPCNVKWSNNLVLDMSKSHSCINFMSSTQGDIFVIFAEIPKDHTTWYYVQINPNGVGLYDGYKLVYSRPGSAIGSLGDPTVFESFFVCLSHNDENDVIIQYGKSDPHTEVGRVLASHLFHTEGVKRRIKFYSFGGGEKEVHLINVKMIRGMRSNLECDYHWVLRKGICVKDCHEECKGFGRCEIYRDPSKCYECKNYFYKNGTQKVCTKECPAGYTLSQKENDKECLECEAGYFKIKIGSEKCSACPKGKFSSKKAAKICQDCPVGSYSNKMGSLDCIECSKGSFASNPGSHHCSLCSGGSYIDEKGKASCKKCPAGQFAEKEGQFQCQPCMIGSYAAKPGASKCKLCAIG